MSRLSRFNFDREYVDLLVAEDAETERHFTKYFGDLLSLKLGHRLRSPALVEDAKQETFVRVLTTLKQKGGLNSPEGLGAFVNSVCNNVLFELYRSDAKADQLDDETEGPQDSGANVEATLIESEERRRVRQALLELPARERDLLRWLFFEERDKDDVCRELKIDRAYLRVLLHRAKLRFRQRLVGDTSQ